MYLQFSLFIMLESGRGSGMPEGRRSVDQFSIKKVYSWHLLERRLLSPWIRARCRPGQVAGAGGRLHPIGQPQLRDGTTLARRRGTSLRSSQSRTIRDVQ